MQTHMPGGRDMNILYKLVLTLLFGVTVVFALQNISTVTVSFLGWSATVPLAMVVIVSYILGAVTGGGLLSLLMRTLHEDTRRSSQP
jgi:lipopolysaccharide assembly protein A